MPPSADPKTWDMFGRPIRRGSKVRVYVGPGLSSFFEGAVQGFWHANEGVSYYVVRTTRRVQEGKEVPSRPQMCYPRLVSPSTEPARSGDVLSRMVSLDPVTADEALAAAQKALEGLLRNRTDMSRQDEAQALAALIAIESHQASLDAELDARLVEDEDELYALDRAMGGSREWDNAVGP